MPGVKVIIQQCSEASILVDNKDKWEHIKEGIIIYLAFMKEATNEAIDEAITTILSLKLVYDPETTKNGSVLDLGADVLIIPQASLAGKIKQKTTQYHGLIDKEVGADMYKKFVEIVTERVAKAAEAENAKKKGTVKCGTYGNRQGLKFVSGGPFTHQLEF
jgi:D-Tyr-tRNAtyr deacylase